jgi:CRISPR system Cascade subunit CasE
MLAPYFLIRVSVDRAAMIRFARAMCIPGEDADQGYVVHAVLAATFDHGAERDTRIAPKPFRIAGQKGGESNDLDVLGYANVDHPTLLERAHQCPNRLAAGVLDLERMTSTRIPSTLARGMRAGFSVHACPVRRVKLSGQRRTEVDIALASAPTPAGAGGARNANEGYCDWLRRGVEKGEAAHLLTARVASSCQKKCVRRTGQAGWHHMQLPEVHFTGTLEVRDGEAFAQRVRSGIGRHRSFGFGLLLLEEHDTVEKAVI